MTDVSKLKVKYVSDNSKARYDFTLLNELFSSKRAKKVVLKNTSREQIACYVAYKHCITANSASNVMRFSKTAGVDIAYDKADNSITLTRTRIYTRNELYLSAKTLKSRNLK